MDDHPVIDLAAFRQKRDKLKLAEAADWGDISRRLTLFAKRVCRQRPSSGDPEDLAQSAIEHFFANIDAWVPEERPLPKHLRSILNGIAIDAARIGPNRRGPKDAASPDVLEKAPTPEDEFYVPTPPQEIDPTDVERVMLDRDEARRVLHQLQVAFAADALALGVLDQFARGNDLPGEQAAGLGATLDAILAARRRIERRARRLRAEIRLVAPGAPSPEGKV